MIDDTWGSRNMILRKLLDVFIHELFMKLWAQCVVYVTFSFKSLFFTLGTVFKHDVVVPSAIFKFRLEQLITLTNTNHGVIGFLPSLNSVVTLRLFLNQGIPF